MAELMLRYVSANRLSLLMTNVSTTGASLSHMGNADCNLILEVSMHIFES